MGGCYGIERGPSEPELNLDVYLDRYDRELRSIDEQLDRLLIRLQERGIGGPEDRVVVTADHGEAFWEHDDYGHSHTLWGETTWVPLIVWDAGGTGEVSDVVGLDALFGGLQTTPAVIRPEITARPVVQHTAATGTTWTAFIGKSSKWMTNGTSVWTGSPQDDPLDEHTQSSTTMPRPTGLTEQIERQTTAPPLRPSETERELLRALGYSF